MSSKEEEKIPSNTINNSCIQYSLLLQCPMLGKKGFNICLLFNWLILLRVQILAQLKCVRIKFRTKYTYGIKNKLIVSHLLYG